MELRKDYILDRWVILSPDRKKRKREFKQHIETLKGICFFCPKNEKFTPKEIGRIEKNKKWIMRWFPNKFPVVEEKGNSEIKTDNNYFTYSSPYGRHEIIVETNIHRQQLWDLPKERVRMLLDVYTDRIKELSKLPNTKYVTIFKNHGKEAGTSLVHSHTQVVSLSFLPKMVRDELETIKRFDHCPYCDILNIEKNSYRRCFENETIVAFTPYASRFNYEIWIFPKRHVCKIEELNLKELDDLSEILHKILLKLKELDVSYNYLIHYGPHFHIEVLPRAATWAGFEFSTDVVVNSVMPEDAAEFYRNENFY